MKDPVCIKCANFVICKAPEMFADVLKKCWWLSQDQIASQIAPNCEQYRERKDA